MRIAGWITKTAGTHPENAILFTFPPRQWLCERASILVHTYITRLDVIHGIPPHEYRDSTGNVAQNGFASKTLSDPQSLLVEWPLKCGILHVPKYRGADKSLAIPGRKLATATEDFEFYISYL